MMKYLLRKESVDPCLQQKTTPGCPHNSAPPFLVTSAPRTLTGHQEYCACVAQESNLCCNLRAGRHFENIFFVQ